ncbi:MAG: hypothetical protein ACLU9S_14375 [Oscillospiraceae bacterium]
MAYTGESLRRARERLAQAKAERESENAEHLRRAYRQVPRLAEIDRALRLTMAQAAQTVFQQGGDPQAEFARIRQENQDLQREREWLIEDNFEEGFLEDAPVCTVCGGSGYVGAQMCECLRELCRQEQKKELTLLTGAARGDLRGLPPQLLLRPDGPQSGGQPPGGYGWYPSDLPPVCPELHYEVGQFAPQRQSGPGKDLFVCLHRPDGGRWGL